jgi:hypothetical protein
MSNNLFNENNRIFVQSPMIWIFQIFLLLQTGALMNNLHISATVFLGEIC